MLRQVLEVTVLGPRIEVADDDQAPDGEGIRRGPARGPVYCCTWPVKMAVRYQPEPEASVGVISIIGRATDKALRGDTLGAAEPR